MDDIRYGGEDAYAWYRWDVRKVGDVGYILDNITRIDKETFARKRVGSMFVQRKVVPAGQCVNYGGGFHGKFTRMFNTPRRAS